MKLSLQVSTDHKSQKHLTYFVTGIKIDRLLLISMVASVLLKGS